VIEEKGVKLIEESFLPEGEKSKSEKAPAMPSLRGLDAAVGTADKAAEELSRADAEKARSAPEDVYSLAMGGGFDRVVTSMFEPVDAGVEYVELRERLRSGRASSANQAGLIVELDRAEDDAMRGAELVARAKVFHDEFEFYARVVSGGMRKKAVAVLEERKAELKAETKTAGKAITNDDVEQEMARQFPDEYLELERRRGMARRGIALFEELANRLSERARDYRQMLARSRVDA